MVCATSADDEHACVASRRASRRWLGKAARCLAVLCACMLSPAWAQSAATAAPAAASAVPPAPLSIYNRDIFVFRAPFLGVSPEERARAARERIAGILRRPGKLVSTVEPAPQGAIVRLGGVLAFVVTPADTDAISESPIEAARRAAAALDVAASESLESRDLRALLSAAAWAAFASVVLVGLVWGLARLRRIVKRTVAEAGDKGDRFVRIGTVEVLRRNHVLAWARRGVDVAFWLIVLVAANEWLGYVLGRFPYTRPWGEQLSAFLLNAGGRMLEAVAHAMPDLAIAIAIFVIARGAARVADAFLRRVQSGQTAMGWLDSDTANPTRRLVTILIWAFAIVMAYPYLPGSDTDAFKGMSVLIGLMISLGATSVIGQGASGLILMYTRTLRRGEYVRVGDHEGTVVDMGVFATRIRTGMGVELTLPSALVLGAVTMNYSRGVRGNGFVVDIDVTIGYDTPWRQVEAMLVEAARVTPGVLADPPPQVFQTALSDFYVAYRLVCHAMPAEPKPRAEVISLLHASVQDVFNAHGVQIMSPHYLGDPATGKTVPRERWYAAPARPPREG